MVSSPSVSPRQHIPIEWTLALHLLHEDSRTLSDVVWADVGDRFVTSWLLVLSATVNG